MEKDGDEKGKLLTEVTDIMQQVREGVEEVTTRLVSVLVFDGTETDT